ncbi:hypothetical protein GT348_02940 [Aristophania vespae]|uniref:Uncharacterized protein n=1 Tax=Aristophania vespae TaxID=2697033 RepID=A0A6P1ND02_9PROT|nr:hypothetical protein [Aristophania vespae]QHI95363.1 hypothetical protein GT348_02940 [Aristophania vespae]
MDLKNISQSYSQFNDQIQDGFQKLENLLNKLQDASSQGNQKAQEWSQDLHSIAESFKGGHSEIGNFLEQIQGFLGGNENQEEGQDRHSGLSSLLDTFLSSGSDKKGGNNENLVGDLLNKFLKK